MLIIRGRLWERRGRRTCHAKGTFLRFARIIRKAAIREYRPGPVNVRRMRSRRLTLDALTLRTRAVVKAMDFIGRAVADAMVRE